jgi:hypothetical protein
MFKFNPLLFILADIATSAINPNPVSACDLLCAGKGWPADASAVTLTASASLVIAKQH